MSDLMEIIKSKEDFDAYWAEHYVPVTYDEVRETYENFVEEMEKNIFLQDYQEKNCINREDFIENLHQDAQFAFQDCLTEVFYDKNPELYETAFAFYEMAQMEGQQDHVAVTFHETFNSLYTEFLNRIFDKYYQ